MLEQQKAKWEARVWKKEFSRIRTDREKNVNAKELCAHKRRRLSAGYWARPMKKGKNRKKKQPPNGYTAECIAWMMSFTPVANKMPFLSYIHIHRQTENISPTTIPYRYQCYNCCHHHHHHQNHHSLFVLHLLTVWVSFVYFHDRLLDSFTLCILFLISFSPHRWMCVCVSICAHI